MLIKHRITIFPARYFCDMIVKTRMDMNASICNFLYLFNL